MDLYRCMHMQLCISYNYFTLKGFVSFDKYGDRVGNTVKISQLQPGIYSCLFLGIIIELSVPSAHVYALELYITYVPYLSCFL